MDTNDRDPPKTEYEPYLTPIRPYIILFIVITAVVLVAGWLYSR